MEGLGGALDNDQPVQSHPGAETYVSKDGLSMR